MTLLQTVLSKRGDERAILSSHKPATAPSVVASPRASASTPFSMHAPMTVKRSFISDLSAPESSAVHGPSSGSVADAVFQPLASSNNFSRQHFRNIDNSNDSDTDIKEYEHLRPRQQTNL